MSKALRCPLCKRPLPTAESEKRFLPFCGPRCADADLGKWLSGDYRFASQRQDDPDEFESAGEGNPA